MERPQVWTLHVALLHTLRFSATYGFKLFGTTLASKENHPAAAYNRQRPQHFRHLRCVPQASRTASGGKLDPNRCSLCPAGINLIQPGRSPSGIAAARSSFSLLLAVSLFSFWTYRRWAVGLVSCSQNAKAAGFAGSLPTGQADGRALWPSVSRADSLSFIQ